MKIKQAGNYDVAIVGAGIAGLSCANYLARGGKKVILLEQNHQAGGCMSGFWRKGFYFDGGDQSFESTGILFPILSELGVYPEHDWHPATYRIKTAFWDFPLTSLEDTRDRMIAAFPDEPGVRIFFAEVEKVSRCFSGLVDPWHIYPLEKPGPKKILAALKWLPSLKRWTDPEFKNRLCGQIKRDDLRHWFLNAGYYKMPFILFGGFWHLWVKDYWYPAGGIQSLMDSLVKKFESLGGEARFKTPVKKILVRDGRAEGVLTEKGEKITADQVVYAGDYQRLVTDVLGESYFKPDFVEKLKRSRRTEAMLNVFLGINLPAEELKKHLQTHHVLFYPDLKVIIPDQNSPRDVHRKTWMELSSPSLESPGLAPPGKSSLVLQTFTNIKWQNYWQNGSESTERTPEYREFKKAVGMELVKGAEGVIPGLSEKIEYMDVGTPLSAVRFTMNSQGASAGWTYHLPDLPIGNRFGFVSFHAPVAGVYTIGQYSLWPGGVPNSALSGKIVANSILGKFPEGQLHTAVELFRKVKKLF
ncbi:MAG: NAD(P)/FAD-dependent oxidoreductase [Proteobacteria bacterium]|nr:NAD(P)/FAD-dependent oxidoreductase [Pseudomonadota bacterium]